MGAKGLQVTAGTVQAGIFRACVALAFFAYAGAAGANDVATSGVANGGSVARSSDFTYGVDAGIGYTDNVTQVPTDKRSDEIFGAGVQFSGLEQGARFQGEMVGDLEHLDYLRNTYSPEVIGNFNGLASFTLLPEHLRWMAEDSFGQGVLDPFAPATPNNREYINTVTTGPTLTLPLGSVTLVNVTARYTRVSYQTSPLDSNDYGGGISIARLLSARSRVSFNVQTTRYDFTDPTNPSYDERQAFARYDIQGTRTRITVDAGYNQLRGSQLNSSGALGRLSAARTISQGSVVTITAGSEYSSSGSFLTQSQGLNGVGLETTPGRQSNIPFTNQYETASWSFTRSRTTLSLSVAHFKQDYTGQSSLDQNLTTAGGRLSRVVYPSWTVRVYGDYSKQAFAQQQGSFHETHGGAAADWRLGRLLTLSLQYDHYRRDSNQALFTFSENRLWLRLQYGNGTPRTHLVASDVTSADIMAVDPFNIQMPAH